jgi:hypothetical protein
MSLVVPQIIGWPGAVSGKVTDNADNGTEMADHIIRTMNLAYIRPCIMSGGAGTEIWEAVPAMDLYKDYLNKGAGVTNIEKFSKNPDGITVAFQHMSPVSESYSNDFSQNSLLAGLTSGNQNLQDIGMLMGAEGSYDKLKKKSEGTKYKGIFDGIEEMQQKAVDMSERMGGDSLKTFTKDTTELMKKFDHKIDFPMMWRGSSFSTSYNLMIRLYNPIPLNDDYYERLIIAPLMALLAFVCPKSTDGKTWTYPFIMKFSIPGRADLRAAYCSNISVVKGGDVNDVAYNSRPNMIDINMTINPVHSVKLFSTEELTSDAPSLKREVEDALKTTIEKTPFESGGQLAQNTTKNNAPSASNSFPSSRSLSAQQFAAIFPLANV